MAPGRTGRKTRQFLMLAGMVLVSAASAAEARTLRHVVYDLAVTSYCGLLTPEVQAGYDLEIAELTALSGLSDEAAKSLRIAGWVDADMEWGNRGLGGFKAWCESEGVQAASHFLAIVQNSATVQ